MNREVTEMELARTRSPGERGRRFRVLRVNDRVRPNYEWRRRHSHGVRSFSAGNRLQRFADSAILIVTVHDGHPFFAGTTR